MSPDTTTAIFLSNTFFLVYEIISAKLCSMQNVCHKLKSIDWRNASVGFHTYGALTSKEILDLQEHFPIINTEIDLPADAGGTKESTPMDNETYGIQTMERLKISWFAWNVEGQRKFGKRFVNEVILDAKAKGYLWHNELTSQPG